MDLRAAPEAQQHVQGPRIAPGRGVTVLPPPPSPSQHAGTGAGGAPRNTPPPCTHCLHRMAKRWEDGLGELSTSVL